MPTEVPDTLGNLSCDPSSASSSSSAADAQTSQAQDHHDSGEARLEDMEVAAAAEQSSSARSRPFKKRKTQDPERQQEDAWMVDLRATMKANQALLERLLEERSQPLSRRDA